jgi:diguanylate cyclase (GGDEF)-like protein
MAASQALYLGCLTLFGVGWDPVAHIALSLVAVWMPATVCWLAVTRVGVRRREVLLAAVAVTSFAAGLTCYAMELAAGGSPAFPTFGDVGYLLFYPLMLAALVMALRHQLHGLASSVWLDCAVGFLGAAAVVAVVLSPVLSAAAKGSLSLAAVVSVSYPMFDLLLVASVAGIAALRDVRLGSRWVLLFAGLLVFAAADLDYALQLTAGSYVFGTPLDAGWPLGLALVAIWVDGAAPHDARATHDDPATGSTALVVSSVSTAAGLGVLVMSSRTPLSALAVALAAVTLMAAAARTQLAFRQLVRMADLRRQAITDHLTSLPNRRALYVQAGVRLADPAHRRRALLMLDLDKFKEVNDSLGHQAGDQLLIQVGVRLSEQVRAGDLLVRLGGDEFAVLLEEAGHDQALGVAKKLRAALARPFTVEDVRLHSSASVGIALFPDHGTDLSTLLRKADIAMYKAKTSGRGHHVYSSFDDADAAGRLKTVEELRTALTNEQMVVHFQPKIDLSTSDVHGVEALVRWDHPTRGLLYPDAFVNLVEESGLMPALTRMVLALSLDQAASWHAQGQQLTIAVNLSASSLVDNALPEQVASMLAIRSLPPRALQLEITEEFLMADRDRARDILTRLRQSGVQISIDDFGTGYSSLAYLRDLPIDELKLDKSFIFPMADDARAAALVASTIALAHSLGLRMVAEGVENHVAYTELARLGCDQAQGYFMSRPVPAAELDHWLSTRHGAQRLAEVSSPTPAVTVE